MKFSATNLTHAACVSQSFRYPDLFGAKTLSLTAQPVTNFSIEIAQGGYPSHDARNVTNLGFCNVSLIYTHPGQRDSINVQVWLPLEGWNQRLQGAAGGGFLAGLNVPSMAGALSDGFAVVSTDAGHKVEDASTWALLSPGNVDLYALQNWASVSLNDAAVIGKSITKDFYGQKPIRSYWNGCSGGGRQGLVLAQRYPDAFDGILAAAPGINWNTALVGGLYFPLVIQLSGQGHIPNPCEIYALSLAAVAACDADDGVIDNIISDPAQCKFDPSTLVGQNVTCPGINATISQAAALGAAKAWDAVRTANGSFLMPGLNPGALLNLALNSTCDTRTGKCQMVPFSYSEEFVRYWLIKRPEFDWTTLTWDDFYRLWDYSVDTYTDMTASNDPDLSDFRASGGKLITWHGLADPAVPTNTSRIYYSKVGQLDPSVSQYYRYFEAPGVSHCGGGNGPYPGHVFESLIAWVEEGKAPDVLQGISLPTANGTVYHRPICAYPQMATYKGSGDVTLAASWKCV
ncbi:hypothetical protein AYO20_11245 [Fonsecaea nubica]|uniref:Carboxylic ester hydrolase n=1 Tax=Fonsecaea nubica TaxID=856822 RepID=A0A178BZ46_9EURO|nr:hypothetical protein AYO20_11245 [Fonsecaea nubica]OAL22145.1 hypothetical protein AYO20_11245 [Fonsecaea nubica]